MKRSPCWQIPDIAIRLVFCGTSHLTHVRNQCLASFCGPGYYGLGALTSMIRLCCFKRRIKNPSLAQWVKTFIFFYRDCEVPVTSEEWQGSCERDQQRGQDAPAHRRGNQQPATHQAPHQPGLRQKLSHEARRKFDLNLFILGLLQNKLSQLILITLDCSFRMVSISFF